MLELWINKTKGIGVRPTQLTKTNSITEDEVGCGFVPEVFMNVEICEKCRPDTYAVPFTLRKKLIRVISSRDMSKKERKIYEKG